MKRISQINRKTNETNTILDIDLDGEGISNIQTNIGFFNHMIDLLAFHSNININLNADGDIDVCDHHLIEDVGIALGKCMNEALVMVSVDISGRSYLHFEGEFKRENIGDFSTEMVKEFFRAVAFNAGITLHIRVLYGENDHHKIEGIFKAFGRALKEAITIEGNSIPSSKGVL